MPPIKNWSRESRTPALRYRNRETPARAILHRAPNTYRHKWRGAILVRGYPIWTQGFETKEKRRFRDELRDRPAPNLTCPECPDDDIVVGMKSASDGAIKVWFNCRACGYEAPSRIVYPQEQ
jgi:predicted RNA-binding Zn-ribbon protein involved in translation (DUF1610 family)